MQEHHETAGGHNGHSNAAPTGGTGRSASPGTPPRRRPRSPSRLAHRARRILTQRNGGHQCHRPACDDELIAGPSGVESAAGSRNAFP